jgi:folate-binding Fe-S cluster repair protein YgfZ
MTLLAAQTAEYLAATQRCAVVDLSTRETLRLTGPDRESFLQGMVTNDVEKLAVGSSCPVAMLTAKGAMVGDGRVLKLADALLLDTGAGRGAAVRDFLNKYLIIDEAQNLTPKQMKTLITRAGPGTKIVCMGNLAQIDTPYLTEGSSGLTYAVDRFKGWAHGGHITLARGERSRLADFASDAL